MSRPPPASGDQVLAKSAPSQLKPPIAHARGICDDRASLLSDLIFEAVVMIGEGPNDLPMSALFEPAGGDL
jgi:hypothetical protein